MPRRVTLLILALAVLVGCAAQPSTLPTASADPSSPIAPTTGTTAEPPPTLGEAGLGIADVPRADASAGDARAAAGAINAFGFDLLRLLEDDDNAVLSPASIAIALGMARAGARGATAAEMDAVLRGIAAPENALSLNAMDQALASRTKSHPDQDGELRDVTLRIANAPFSQAGMLVEDAYLTALAETYGAGLRIVDFAGDADGSRRIINAWVDEQTEHRIEELLPEDAVGALTRLVLVNAIYLKAPWTIPFAEEATADAAFTRADGSTVQVPMMSATRHASYAEGDGWRAVDLPYLGGELSMLLILPNEPEAFLAGADAVTLDAITSGLAPIRVDLAMPKFSIETAAELKDLLSALGMPTAFDPDRADFSGITTAEALYVDAVIHQANIDVDEAGTEAAAATAVIGAVTGGPPPETVEVRFDRPFVFALRDVQTGAVLFLGTVGDPSAD